MRMLWFAWGDTDDPRVLRGQHVYASSLSLDQAFPHLTIGFR